MNAIFSTGKTLLNALAFANVNGIDELRSKLERIDAPATATADAAEHVAAQPSYSPSIKHVQGAL